MSLQALNMHSNSLFIGLPHSNAWDNWKFTKLWHFKHMVVFLFFFFFILLSQNLLFPVPVWKRCLRWLSGEECFLCCLTPHATCAQQLTMWSCSILSAQHGARHYPSGAKELAAAVGLGGGTQLWYCCEARLLKLLSITGLMSQVKVVLVKAFEPADNTGWHFRGLSFSGKMPVCASCGSGIA